MNKNRDIKVDFVAIWIFTNFDITTGHHNFFDKISNLVKAWFFRIRVNKK